MSSEQSKYDLAYEECKGKSELEKQIILQKYDIIEYDFRKYLVDKVNRRVEEREKEKCRNRAIEEAKKLYETRILKLEEENKMLKEEVKSIWAIINSFY
jgi:hypothetical protein